VYLVQSLNTIIPSHEIGLSQQKRKQVTLRVKRIHGHVHAITRMLDEGRSYSDIVHQVRAVRSALDGVIQVIVDDLVEDCVAKMGRKEPFDDTLHELQAVVAMSR
jgi:DNA-binding FrmR family transcriptional regulator